MFSGCHKAVGHGGWGLTSQFKKLKRETVFFSNPTKGIEEMPLVGFFKPG